MAPKKASNQDKAPAEPVNGSATNNISREKKPSSKSSPKKRKAQDDTTKESSKTARRSTRGAPAQTVDPVKLINFLLSPESLSLCRPKDETSDQEARGKDFKTYSTSDLTPFEELESALILSRPIGHMLGLRSIRTLFNEPHNLTTPRAINAAGRDGCRAVLDEARTQHRQKTADELVILAEAVSNSLGKDEDDTNLQRIRDECGHDVDKEREMLKKNVKGMAKTGIDIFARRIQRVWKEWYPFADDKTSQALEDLGLEGDERSLVNIIEDNWSRIQRAGDVQGSDGDRKRQVFVTILGRAVGAGLEGNIEEVKQASQ